ncbi:MAG TPA: response regulator [Rhodospirillales bacterium]|nr:response regulator [Rhodospirillales bacterium]
MAKKKKKISFYVVDDDPIVLEVMAKLLKGAGYSVTTSTESADVITDIARKKPDCVISDLMMPEVDGLQLCQQVLGHKGLKNIKFIVVSAKAYEFDLKRAYGFGAHGYLRKPINPETFIERIERIIDDHIDLTFWGVRGTLPVSGERFLKYGGNTSCVTLEFPRQQFFIFDCGSGIKNLGDWFLAQSRKGINAKIFISHPHWDHINAIPFFAPLYAQGNEFEVLGANQGDITMREIVSAQMEGVYFPITFSQFASRVYFHDLEEEDLVVLDIDIKSKLLSHPGKCLGYRINYNGRSICYITDNEMYVETSDFYDNHYEKRLAKFVEGADVLITDSTYTDEEYLTKEGWGHSCISKVVNLADTARVKTLYLFHHDPDQDDAAIDRKLDTARAMLKARKSKTKCLAPREGENFRV